MVLLLVLVSCHVKLFSFIYIYFRMQKDFCVILYGIYILPQVLLPSRR